MDNSAKYESGVSPLKLTVYCISIFLLTVFQTTVAGRFGFFGTVPAIMLGFTTAAAFFEGPRGGAAVGATSGFFADAAGSAGISLLPLFYALAGWFIGDLIKQYGNAQNKVEKLILWSITLGIAALAGIFMTGINLLLSAGRFGFIDALVHIMLPEALGTYVWSWIFGPIFIILERSEK